MIHGIGMDRRRLMAFASAGLASTLAPAAVWARARLTASATRISNTTLRLTWSSPGEAASIYVSPNPDADASAMRLVEQARGGAAEAPGAIAPRPYFLVRTRDGEARVAERLLPLQGGRNFRDLGGYRAADGRQVRWGRLYRSGVMTGLTAQDLDYLDGLGVRVICDLRSPRERAAEPSPFVGHRDAEVLTLDYSLPSIAERLRKSRTREDAVAVLAGSYVELLEILKPQFAELLARLVKGDAPLAMNCTAGKDRTGIASALILSLLGVPRETVVADYALSQVYTPTSFYWKPTSPLAGVPAPVRQVAYGSDPAVIRALLVHVDAKYGGPERLAKSGLGMTDASIAQLRRTYLI